MKNLVTLVPLTDKQIDIMLDALATESRSTKRFSDPGEIFERKEDINVLGIHLIKHQSKISIQPKDIA